MELIPAYHLITPWEIGNEIRRLRIASGLRQSDLAEAAGVSRQWIGQVERGHPRAELGKISALLRALNAHITITVTATEAP